MEVVIRFAEEAVSDFRATDDYDAVAIAFNMDAENNLVHLSLTSAENQAETYAAYRKSAYLDENLQPHKKYGSISKLPFYVEELWEKPNIASLELMTEEQLKEFRGAKRVKKFYTICGNALLDFMSTDSFDNLLGKGHDRFFFDVINKGDSSDIAMEYMRVINKNRQRR